ncbi:unannotated protein [freshwater metagenome]|uniref:Unannotated protein n=1 Tax=freshwater metagenome TaxID=449393 RepID=A0A6J7KIL6_9ZZZZ
MGRDRTQPFIVDLRIHDPGPGVESDAVARKRAIRTGGAEPAHGHEDDLRIDLAQALVAETTTFESSRAHCFDHNIGGAHELFQDFNAGWVSEIDHHTALAAVEMKEKQRGALDDRPGHISSVVTTGWLNLDDVGSEVAQRGRDRCRAQERDLHDPHPGERSVDCHRSTAVARTIAASLMETASTSLST